MSTSTQDPAEMATAVMHDGDTDLEAFFGHFAEDCRFIWSNNEPVEGLEAIQAEVGSTLAGVASLSHEIHHTWSDNDSAALQMTVAYELENGAKVGTPAITVMRFHDGKIVEYRIYQDPTPLKDAQANG